MNKQVYVRNSSPRLSSNRNLGKFTFLPAIPLYLGFNESHPHVRDKCACTGVKIVYELLLCPILGARQTAKKA